MSVRTSIKALGAVGAAALIGAGVGAVAAALALCVALGPVAISGVFMAAEVAFLLGIPLAMIHAVLLGLPLYLAVRRWWGHPGWAGSGLFGLAIGVLPLAILIGVSPGGGVGPTALDRAGVPLAVFAMAGTAAGLAFRWLLGDERDAEPE